MERNYVGKPLKCEVSSQRSFVPFETPGNQRPDVEVIYCIRKGV